MLTLNILTPCSSISIVSFKQVNVGWDLSLLGKGVFRPSQSSKMELFAKILQDFLDLPLCRCNDLTDLSDLSLTVLVFLLLLQGFLLLMLLLFL